MMMDGGPWHCMQGADGRLQLLATGTVHSVDPDRIVLKKYILTGHPFKINIKVCVG
jgi:pre-rRNA-processing protein TSR1